MAGTVDGESQRGDEQKAMRAMSWKIATAIAVLVLSGCSTTGLGGDPAAQAFSGQTGPANAHVGAAIVEAMAGGLVGGAIGTDLDSRDRRRALEAEYRALEYTPAGQGVSWGRPGSGRYGEVVAGSPYRVGSQDCRQYTHTVHVEQRPRTARGTACRNTDGSWTPLA